MKKTSKEVVNVIIGDKIEQKVLTSGGTILHLHNGASEIVSISGSIMGGDIFSPTTNPELAQMAVEMLDLGTEKRTKEEIENKLATIGASISFRCSPFRINFNAFCLRGDLDTVVEILAEELYTPAFLQNELDVLKVRIISMIKEGKENTRSQSNRALTRILFPKNHPYFSNTSEDELAFIDKVTTADLKAYHQNHFDFSSLMISVVGDLPKDCFEVFDKHFHIGSEPQSNQLPEVTSPNKLVNLKKEILFIPAKANADLVIGQGVLIKYDDPDYLALQIAIRIFGGNGFTARLMEEVRVKHGLTYGVNATLQGVSPLSFCYLVIWATFAPNVVTAGKKIIMQEFGKLVKRGVTEGELREIKKEIVGSYQVSLETTPNLASLLLLNLERGKSKDYIDTYITDVSNIKLSGVNGAIKKYLFTDKVALVVAGTVSKKVLE